jgi:hypothetical protein
MRTSWLLSSSERWLWVYATWWASESRDELLAVFDKNLDQVAAFEEGSLVELRPTSIAVRTATEKMPTGDLQFLCWWPEASICHLSPRQPAPVDVSEHEPGARESAGRHDRT